MRKYEEVIDDAPIIKAKIIIPIQTTYLPKNQDQLTAIPLLIQALSRNG